MRNDKLVNINTCRVQQAIIALASVNQQEFILTNWRSDGQEVGRSTSGTCV
jgi:hypothetical protein